MNNKTCIYGIKHHIIKKSTLCDHAVGIWLREYMIKKQKDGKAKFLTALLYLLAVVVSAFAFVMLMPFGFGSAVALIIAGAFYGAYRLSGNMNKEFEYIVTEDIIDVDVIVNKSKRKRLISFRLENVKVLGDINDASCNHYLSEGFDVVIDATSGRKDKKVYFAVFEKSNKTLVKMELTEGIVQSLYEISPSKIHI